MGLPESRGAWREGGRAKAWAGLLVALVLLCGLAEASLLEIVNPRSAEKDRAGDGSVTHMGGGGAAAEGREGAAAVVPPGGEGRDAREALAALQELAVEEESTNFYNNVTLDDCYKYGKTNCDQACDCGWCGGELCVPGSEEGPLSPDAACPSWEYQCDASPPHSAVEILAVGAVVLLGAALLVGAIGYCVYSKQRSQHIHHLIQTSQPFNTYESPAAFSPGGYGSTATGSPSLGPTSPRAGSEQMRELSA